MSRMLSLLQSLSNACLSLVCLRGSAVVYVGVSAALLGAFKRLFQAALCHTCVCLAAQLCACIIHDMLLIFEHLQIQSQFLLVQGTAAVTLAGLYAAMAVQKKDREEICKQRIIVVGAGSAGTGIADMIAQAMVKHVRALSHAFS